MKSAAATREKINFMCKVLIATLILTAGLTATGRAQGRGENSRFVNQIYLDLLGRPVDPRSEATLQALLISRC